MKKSSKYEPKGFVAASNKNADKVAREAKARTQAWAKKIKV